MAVRYLIVVLIYQEINAKIMNADKQRKHVSDEDTQFRKSADDYLLYCIVFISIFIRSI